MATKNRAKKDAWMDDHDDAHFSDNPAVAGPKKRMMTRRTEKIFVKPKKVEQNGQAPKMKDKKKTGNRKRHAVKK